MTKYAVVISIEDVQDQYHATNIRDQLEALAKTLECHHITHVTLHKDITTFVTPRLIKKADCEAQS